VQANVASLAPQASLVFKATVKKLNDSTVPVVPASDKTAVVHVDETLEGAKTIGDFTGQDITVQLKESNSVKTGDKVLFFANAGTFGKSVSVVEVGHTSAELESAKLRQQIAGARTQQTDQKLKQRLAKADLVIAGKVTAVKDMAGEQKGAASEHDPEWEQATIQVQATAKGNPAKTATVYFAGSRDIRWYQAPKLKVGQEGVFALQKFEDKKRGLSGYAVTDRLDVQPKNQLEHIQTMLKTN